MKISSEKDIKEGVAHLVSAHVIFEKLLPQCGPIPLRLSTSNFAGLASIIVSQQVSKASATAIFNRLSDEINPLDADTFLAAGEPAWQMAGLSRPKQRTMETIAKAVVSGELNLNNLCEIPAQEAEKHMTAIKGIGPWTAEIYLMFCAGHPDIFPAGDLALQEAIRIAMGLKNRPDEKVTRIIASDWAPWRSVAARILWDYYRVVKGDALPV